MNREKLRPGQRHALDVIESRIAGGEPKTAIVLPTRYGKSDVIRLAAFDTKMQGTSACSIVLSPGEYLRSQLAAPDKIDSMAHRYELDPVEARRVRQMTSAYEYRPFSNGEYLLSATMQLATRNIDRFSEIADSFTHSGKPLIIHIDECHETSEEKKRGELVARLEAAGALLVLYTATAIRADGEGIPGFRANILDEENAKRWITTDAGDGVNNRIDVYEGHRAVIELVADHTTTFKEAWEEEPSPLCSLSREVVDVNLNDISDGKEKPILLSQSKEAKKYLSKAVRHPIVIEKAAELFVRELQFKRKLNDQAAGIIFSCSDLNGDHNKHAKDIRAEIEKIAPELEICIVTMKSEEGDETSSKQLERFIGKNGRPGRGDVLIVKQMGGAGLDAGRLKVELDLSPIRTVASTMQRLMRVATPWMGMMTASVITIADPLMNAIWDKYVVEEGGEAATSKVDLDMRLIDSYLKEKESVDPFQLEILSAHINNYDDNKGVEGDIANLDLVNDLLRRFPELGANRTKAQLSEQLSGFGSANGYERPVASLNSIIASKQNAIVNSCKNLAQSECPYNPKNSAPHVNRLKFWMNQAKNAAGVTRDVELEQIVSTRTLEVMINFLAQ